MNPTYELHFYGAGGATLKTTNQAIFFHGNVTDLKQIYGDAQLLIMTSTIEGTPRVIIEAASFGVPAVIFNSYGAAAEMVDNEQAGKLVTPFDEAQFLKAIDEVISD